MKHLFIARHANYGPDHRIDDVGRMQMKVLAYSVRKIVGDGKIKIISSSAPRALDSALEMANNLGISPNFEQDLKLWSGKDRAGRLLLAT